MDRVEHGGRQSVAAFPTVWMRWPIVALALALAGCATPPAPPATVAVQPPPAGQVLARNDRFIIYEPDAGDSLRSLAGAYLGDESKDWMIAEFNGITSVKPGEALVIPLRHLNPAGIREGGYQTVPILVYHRFGAKEDKLVVSPATFAAQLDHLARNDYRVIRLADLLDFLDGKQALPRRSVVITIDDGYASNYHHAYPLLKKYGFPATIFLYTDFAGAADALTWGQMAEMLASGLVDIQPHSKTHVNLSERLAGESDTAYRERLDNEIVVPRDLLRRRLSIQSVSYAYPYGDANEVVVERIAKAGYRLAVTVNPGGNPAFGQPLLRRRTMIFGDQNLEQFKARLHVFNSVDTR